MANDDPFILFSTSQALSRHFTLVHSVENGKLALEKFMEKGTFYYQAIILDINMPVMDGIETCIMMLDLMRD